MNSSIFNSEKHARSYFRNLIALTALFLFLLVLFNLLIDPFNSFQLFNFNLIKIKPFLSSKERISKALTVKNLEFENLIMGSSTAEFGIRPDHPGWQGKKTYNYAIGGPNIYEIFRYLQHATATNTLKKVVIPLDFFSFNTNWFPTIFKEERLSITETMEPNPRYYKDIFLALSIDSTISSLLTLLNFNKPTAFKQNGFVDWPLRRTLNYEGDQHRIFQGTIGFVKTLLLPAPNHRFDFKPIDEDGFYFKMVGNRSTLAIFSELIKFSAAHKIETHIILPPIHEKQIELIYASGLGEKYEFWKNSLREIICKSNNTMAFLWEFDGKHFITTESELGPNDKGEMKYFYDSHHYKPIVGDMMLEKILQPEKEPFYPNFGHRTLCLSNGNS